MDKDPYIDFQNALARRLRNLCLINGLSMVGLAAKAHLSKTSIYSIVSGERQTIAIETLNKICDALEITLSAFFDSSVFDHTKASLNARNRNAELSESELYLRQRHKRQRHKEC